MQKIVVYYYLVVHFYYSSMVKMYYGIGSDLFARIVMFTKSKYLHFITVGFTPKEKYYILKVTCYKNKGLRFRYYSPKNVLKGGIHVWK